MPANLENPILLVKPRPQDHQQRIISGFGEPKEIVPVTTEFRAKITSNIAHVEEGLRENFQNFPDIPSVISLRLNPDAMAKTHRPMLLLERAEMLPIGTRHMGELLLPATAQSLERLSNIIDQNQAKLIRANISTIDKFEVYGSKEVLRLDEAHSYHQLKDWVEEGKPFVLEEFTNGSVAINNSVRTSLNRLFDETGVEVLDIHLVSSGGSKKVIKIQSVENLLILASFPGVRSLTPVEEFMPIEAEPQMFSMLGGAPQGILDFPNENLPIVGVIDSGIPHNDPVLKNWVIDHSTYVLPPDTDHLHGTFVAGLIAGARILNSANPKFPSVQARVLDVAALSTTSPGTTFDEMFERIQETVRAFPEIKVWNCSFGSNGPGMLHEFGQLSQELDALADELDILFVIAAGNYSITPLRDWPPAADLLGNDRISQPAESIRSLTVGSVAHFDNLVLSGEPSPFSRRGPGSAKTPKPDVTHCGGNCDVNGGFVGTGVRSLLPNGGIAESIGTSFSTPLTSAICANIWQALIDKGHQVNKEIVKALVIHAAAVSAPFRSAEDRNYYGFGTPEAVVDTLFCDSDTFTMVFEVELFDGIIWEKTPFPIPACLHPGGDHLKAEMVITLVYSPPVDGGHGAEYIRANVDASFGSYDADHEGELHHHGLVPLDVPAKTDLYEKAMIENGFKWSPVKVYRGKFPRGKAGKNFRLRLELLRRAGEPSRAEPQKAVVLITFKGVQPGQPVYADGVRAIGAANWITESIASRASIRV